MFVASLLSFDELALKEKDLKFGQVTNFLEPSMTVRTT